MGQSGVATDRIQTIAREDAGSAGQFVLRSAKGVLGKLDFTRPKKGVLQINHVEVNPSQRGSGLGRRLVEAAVQWARDERLTVVPRCSYARSVVEGDPALRDVL